MPILHYETKISGDGSITLPLLPEYRGRNVVVVVEEECGAASREDRQNQVDPARIMPNGKTAVEDFLQFCTGIVGEISDEELDRLKYERLMEKYR